MKKWIRSHLVLCCAAALLLTLSLAALFQPNDAVAFNHTWNNFAAPSGVNYGLWADMPVGNIAPMGSTNEAGLLWFNNASGSQLVTYWTGLNVTPGTNWKLTARAAVSDKGTLKIAAYEPSGTSQHCAVGQGDSAALNWGAAAATGQYVTKMANLPQTGAVKNICVTLTKPNGAIHIGRSNALLDSIQILDGQSHVKWNEGFVGSP